MVAMDMLHERFMRDSLKIRLGGIASDLSRFSRLARSQDADQQVLENVLTELKLFTEWAAPDAEPALQKQILKLQRLIARASTEGSAGEKFSGLEKEARLWSGKILKVSGLIPERKK